MKDRFILFLMLALASVAGKVRAQVTYTGMDEADAFVATGAAGTDLTGVNFGGAGILVVAPAASPKGEFQSLLRFDLAPAATLFNTTYGSNQWIVASIILTLTSNYGTAGVQPNNAIFPTIHGGNFTIEWLADNDWTEGTGMPNQPTADGVTYDSLGALTTVGGQFLCTNTYTPPGNNVPVSYALPALGSWITNVQAGSKVTLLLRAADDGIGYLFNSYNYGRGNQPLIQITAVAAEAPPVVISGSMTNGGFAITAVGTPHQTYSVQAVSHLVSANWQTIGTVTADAAGYILFDEPARQPQRFYRLSR